MMARPTTPPTDPPTIAPVLLAEFVGLVELVEPAELEVDEEAVGEGEAVDESAGIAEVSSDSPAGPRSRFTETIPVTSRSSIAVLAVIKLVTTTSPSETTCFCY